MPYEFEATIEQGPSGGAWVRVPADIKAFFKTRERVKVDVSFDGEPFKASLVQIDDDEFVIGVRKAMCDKIGKRVGDLVNVSIEQDLSRRTVSLPKELRAALKRSRTANIVFAKLPYADKRAYAERVTVGQDDKARRKRADKVIAELVATTRRK